MKEQETTAAKAPLGNEQIRGRVEYWKQVISVQMHFNDMCIRLRWLCLTGVATLLAASAVAAKDRTKFTLFWDVEVGVAAALLAISTLVAIAMWVLERGYYFRMLIASVTCAEQLEDVILPMLELPGSGLTKVISASVSRRGSRWLGSLYYGAITLVTAVLTYLSLRIS